MVQHVRVGRHPGEVPGEGGLGGRDRDERRDPRALGRGGLREEVPVVVAEGVVGEDHRDLLAEVLRHPARDGRHLGPHVGDARLEDVPVELPRRHVVALADHEVGDLQLSRPRRRPDDHVGEEGAEDEVHLVLGGELLDHLGAPLRIGAVVLGDDLDLAAVDPALLVDDGRRRGRRALVPAPVHRADAGPVHLEAQPERRLARARRLGRRPRGREQARPAGQAGRRHRRGPLEHASPGDRHAITVRHGRPLSRPASGSPYHTAVGVCQGAPVRTFA